MEKIYLAALQMVAGIGNMRLKGLVSFFGSAQQAWLANKRDLFLCGYLDETIYNKLLIHREKIDIYTLARDWERNGIRICSHSDSEYPKLLLNTYNAPQVLFYRGTLPITDHLIAIVGARKATSYGKNVAQLLASELNEAGVWVVSGAARGIDTAAHQGALVKDGYTIAVLGCGVDINYPPENGKLINQIAESGAVVSEYAPGTIAHPGHFPARNRIINGLSRGVVVVEAAERSGALITADFALEEGRDVFAVPGSIFSQSSKGAHRLIKQGAKLIDGAADILEEYHIAAREKKIQRIDLTSEEAMVYDILTYDNSLGIEDIVMKTKLSTAVIAYILLQFELRGLVTEHSGKRYLRCAKEGVK
ncbi:DNA-processing protein DprA [Pelosinus propionicus]|uniref:DNA processing protein n=1 Tax=Pelosinus propionicus DSM 13327 TaxID=1123291 RepID=A0A1I4JZK1_9FIRM|nr:DNA-processing protein DprA [Pelosinus propionicus]SFL71932.1 DNA processing protein [Pelosinus propionicus DSM 13327]